MLAGIAYVKESGVRTIAGSLAGMAQRAEVFVGIRNDITSYQGLVALLRCGSQVWAVDTATKHRVYHPKLYLTWAAKEAHALIGSANLTAGGLRGNIEASARLRFNLRRKEDRAVVESIRTAFETLSLKHPQHVFRVPDESAAARLLEEGRLVDETLATTTIPAGLPVKDRKDGLRPMSLRRFTPQGGKVDAPVLPAVVMAPGGAGLLPVWRSKPLTERDLNIPKSGGTHATGSMGLKAGAWQAPMDHRHYFREQVFAAADWEEDEPGSRWERASILAGLKVKGIWHGIFSFKLSHNRDTDSPTYKQNNFMTQLHWGTARPLIARDDLLGRELTLYRDLTWPDGARYLIEID